MTFILLLLAAHRTLLATSELQNVAGHERTAHFIARCNGKHSPNSPNSQKPPVLQLLQPVASIPIPGGCQVKNRGKF